MSPNWNIPGLEVSYHVKGGHTLGFVYEATPWSFSPLVGGLHGHDPKNGPTAAYDLTPATLADFERFRVSPKGHIA